MSNQRLTVQDIDNVQKEIEREYKKILQSKMEQIKLLLSSGTSKLAIYNYSKIPLAG